MELALWFYVLDKFPFFCFFFGINARRRCGAVQPESHIEWVERMENSYVIV